MSALKSQNCHHHVYNTNH